MLPAQTVTIPLPLMLVYPHHAQYKQYNYQFPGNPVTLVTPLSHTNVIGNSTHGSLPPPVRKIILLVLYMWRKISVETEKYNKWIV